MPHWLNIYGLRRSLITVLVVLGFLTRLPAYIALNPCSVEENDLLEIPTAPGAGPAVTRREELTHEPSGWKRFIVVLDYHRVNGAAYGNGPGRHTVPTLRATSRAAMPPAVVSRETSLDISSVLLPSDPKYTAWHRSFPALCGHRTVIRHAWAGHDPSSHRHGIVMGPR
jgi:hypothetical protein